MVKRIITGILFFLLSAGAAFAQCQGSDREYDGFLGTPKIVKIDTAKIVFKEGKALEEHRHQERVVKFDAAGNMTEQLTNGPYVYHTYAYTAKGDRLEKSARTAISTGPPTLDDFGFPSRIYLNTEFLRTVFKCNKQNHRSEEELYKRITGTALRGGYQSVTLVKKTTYDYDGAGHRTVSILSNGNGEMVQRYTFAYNGSPHPAEMTEYNSRGQIVAKEYYTYELDDKSNWTKRITTKAPNAGNWALANPIEVTYQTITY